MRISSLKKIPSGLINWTKLNTATFLLVLIAFLVGTIFLIIVLQASSGRREVERHRHATENLIETNRRVLDATKAIVEAESKNVDEHRRQNQKAHDTQLILICDLVTASPRATDTQREICKTAKADARSEADQQGDALPGTHTERVAPQTPTSSPTPRPQAQPEPRQTSSPQARPPNSSNPPPPDQGILPNAIPLIGPLL